MMAAIFYIYIYYIYRIKIGTILSIAVVFVFSKVLGNVLGLMKVASFLGFLFFN